MPDDLAIAVCGGNSAQCASGNDFAMDPNPEYQAALSLLNRGQAEQAAAMLRGLVGRFPGNPELLFALGTALAYAVPTDADEATKALVAACRRKASLIPVVYAQATQCLQRRLSHQAISGLRAYLQLQGKDAEAWNRLGVAYNQLGRFDKAVPLFEKCIALDGGSDMALSNLGNALYRTGHLHRALDCYDQALKIAPGNVETRWNRSLCKLALGDFEDGFADFEIRWQRKGNILFAEREFFTLPRWTGKEELRGRKILLHSEQGLGDCIQFIRYAPMVAALGADVILEVPMALKLLVARTFCPNIPVYGRGEALPEFELHCPLMSLPRLFGTRVDSIVAGVPYLLGSHAKARQWGERLGERSRRRLGLVWSSGVSDPLRDIPLEALEFLGNEDFELIGLQLEIKDSDQAFLPRIRGLKWMGPELRDFDDTAALIAQCDLVLSVDTSVAHLAGALGTATWILLPFAADWRWLAHRQDTPWYPTARLFRQGKFGDWSEPIAELATALRQWGAVEHQR